MRKIAVLSSDLFGSARALKAQIEEIAEGDTDIIIGTQLVAKGHNFPRLTLVGVVDADLGLAGLGPARGGTHVPADAAGGGARGAGRGQGVALMQTFQPEHPVIRAILSGDEEGFWRAEAAEREATGMPPYGRLAGIIISADAAAAFDLGSIWRAMTRRSGGGRRRLWPRARAHRAGARPAPGAASGQGAQGRAHAGRPSPGGPPA
jgi:primosomal protein N' (replication factor Y)